MSEILPFKGLRPVASKAALIASPPYDVLNSKEARELVKNNPDSFLHIVKPEIDLPEDTDIYSDKVYAQGKKSLQRLIDKNFLVKDKKPLLYLYRQIMPVGNKFHIQTGVVAGASVVEYEQSLIKKHEYTRVIKEQDRTKHVEMLNASTGPVFLTYKATEKIDMLVDSLCNLKPVYDFKSPDGISHIFWIIEKEVDISALIEAFKDVPCLYVADGHHRSASACTVAKRRREANPNHKGDEPYNSFLSVIFPHNQMMILDYNRVVKDLNGLTPEEFFKAIDKNFTYEKTESPKPVKEHDFGMFLDNTWYRLSARAGSFDLNDPVAQLDVAILQENLLAPVLGIGDPRADDRIDFIGGIRGLKELEKRVNTDCKVAFALYPTPIEQLMTIADADRVMPPKSTWFEPKLRSGLVTKFFDE